MRAVVTVIGKDKTGIIAKVSAFLAEKGVNILDISQTILQEYFAMIMLVDMSGANEQLSVLATECREMGEKIGMSIHLQHEEIFNAMHSI
ncbi:MAG: ACT domain-containing protein [Clostridia bacterium]|nr:ACT domain-containing protein [Clostridia bacterium]MCD8308513.1 ACT domain-containing protein [Clostridia bacterium]